jgi:adenosylmethionine-8-amino-7-oxononanoate aminotransferase
MSDHVFHRSLDRPVAVTARGCTITTADGGEYLDGAGGAIACSIGHGRDEIVAAMATQASAVAYVHATQFATNPVARLARRIAAIAPVDDARVFPVSGGSEANETALKLARSYHVARGDHDRHVVLARAGAYHGNSRGALDASDRSAMRAEYEPWLGHTVRVSMANPYRDGRSGAEHAAEFDRVVVDTGPERIAAFIAEPVSGATLGALVPPDDYWPAIAQVCERHEILLILDEVMTGFGRTGAWFAADHWGIRPDMMTAGKGASGGYWPLGLCIASGHIYDTVTAAANFMHGFTWSHHPVGSAVAEATIGVIEREHLVEASRDLGRRGRAWLHDALDGHPNVGDIRGLGLLMAIEFVSDRDSKAPFERSERVAERIVAAAFERRLTVYPCGSAVDGSVGDAVLLGPPLCVAPDELREMTDRLVAAVLAVLPVSSDSGNSSRADRNG